MAKSTRSNRTENRHVPDGDTLDAEESLREEIPGELARRVAMYWDSIAEVAVQYMAPSGSWNLLKKRLKLSQPPDLDVDEICMRALEVAQDHASGSEPAPSYRVRFLVKLPDSSKLQPRFCPIRPLITGDGMMQFVDDQAAGGGEMDPLAGLIEPFTDHAIRSLGGVVEATEGYASVARGFKEILGVVTDAAREVIQMRSADAELQLRREEIEARRDMESYLHQQRLAKYQHMSDFLSDLTGPIAEMFAEYFDEMMGDATGESGKGAGQGKGKRQRAKPDPGGRGGLAAELDQWLQKLGSAELAAFREIFSEDEWSLVEQARKVGTDKEFAALFTKMREGFVSRGVQTKQFQDAVIEAVGKYRAIKFAKILRKLQRFGV